MPKAQQISTAPTNDGATVGYEAWLWQMADALRCCPGPSLASCG